MEKNCLPIGIIDSGVGGISVLKEIKKLLPHENYLYMSDTENAPYGTKTEEEIVRLTDDSVKRLLLYPCKAIVIACNTATAAAADVLRRRYPFLPIIGLEPAVIPAARQFPGKDILVLSTVATEKTERFKRLISVASEKSRIVTLPTQRIVSFVEAGMEESYALLSYLKSELYPYRRIKFSAVVLGCTHFPFAKNTIEKALGYAPCFFDGAVGAAKRVRDIIFSEGLRSACEGIGNTVWLENKFSLFGRKMSK